MLIHASAVALRVTEAFQGVLLLGPSGSGKSDLALRLIDQGALLVADDQTELSVAGGRLHAHAPPALFGRIEVRGVGILRLRAVPQTALALAIELGPRAKLPRIPDPAAATFLGLTLPRLSLHAFDASTPAKIRLAVSALQSPPSVDVTFPFASQ